MSKVADEKAELSEAREKLTDAIEVFDWLNLTRNREEVGRVIGTEIWNSLVTLHADGGNYDEDYVVYLEATCAATAISRGIVLSLVSQCM